MSSALQMLHVILSRVICVIYYLSRVTCVIYVHGAPWIELTGEGGTDKSRLGTAVHTAGEQVHQEALSLVEVWSRDTSAGQALAEGES